MIAFRTTTPPKLTIPKKPVKPKGFFVTRNPSDAPSNPSGIAAMMTRGSITERNWNIKIRKIAMQLTSSALTISGNVSFWFSYSPPYHRRYPGGSGNASVLALRRSST